MDEPMRKRFVELKVIGQRFNLSPKETSEKDISLISYLKSLIENGFVKEFEDIGFCYWNISDNYALLKDGHSVFDNHKKFCEYIRNEETTYLYWLVCDATQRLALQKDGYNEFWWNLYRKAIEENENNEYYFAAFNAHRAALYTNNSMEISQDNFAYAKWSCEKFLSKTKATSEYSFYKLIYLSQILKFSKAGNISEMCKLCTTLFKYLSEAKKENAFLVGEWKSFITPFDKRKQGVVGITSAINALISANHNEEAKELYFDACSAGLPKNHYVETRLKFL